MLTVIESLLLLGALLVWWKLRDNRKYSGYPPGPTRLPLFGNLFNVALQFTLYPPLAFQKLAAKYGDVMFLKLGMLETVVISSHEAMKEVFQSDANSDKAMIPLAEDRLMGGNYGLVISNGNVWQTLHRFTIRTLRDFGFGKSASMDKAINEEYEKLERHLQSCLKQGKGIIHAANMFSLPVLNVVWRLVTGKSYELDDATMKKLISLSDDYLRSTHVFDISIAYPVLRTWFPGWSGKIEQMQCLDNLKQFFEEVILEHKKSGAFYNPECFIDVFLAKMEENETENNSYFTLNQLVYVLLDIFQAAADTTSGVLAFSLLHMIRNPQIQSRVREEINSVVPPDSPITIGLKPKLPYTTATILETMRRTTVLSFPALRDPFKDILIRGHKIKKGTPITLNFEAVHMQKSIWEDPEAFRPERFLTSDGTRINSKLSDCLVAFGGGKRACLGQPVAEATLLIYFANLMRHFEFTNVANQPLPSMEPKSGLTNNPQSFEMYVVQRN